MGEIRQTNFRIDQDTADIFRHFCEEKGFNQAQGFDHIIQVLELNNAKNAIPGRVVEIESFERLLKEVLSAYLTSIEVATTTELRVRENFAAELDRNKATITLLQEQNAALEKIQAESKEELKLLQKDLETVQKFGGQLKKQLEEAAKNASEKEQYVLLLKDKLSREQLYRQRNEEAKQERDSLKEELLALKKEQEELLVDFRRKNSSLEDSLCECRNRLSEQTEEIKKLTDLAETLKAQLTEEKHRAEQEKLRFDLTLQQALAKQKECDRAALRETEEKLIRLSVKNELLQEQLTALKQV